MKEFGGIAQLVERLVRNEKARGSNPLTSSLRSQGSGERGLSRRSFSEGGHLFALPHDPGELRLGVPTWEVSHTCMSYKARATQKGSTPDARVISARD